jgi:hypothetical protein
MFCNYCTSLSIKLLREGDYLHQPSFFSLSSSAQEGCPECHIIQRALTASSSGDSSYADSDTYVRFEQVKAYLLSDPSSINWLSLRCIGRKWFLFLATDDGL